jgi:hypothetical protein
VKALVAALLAVGASDPRPEASGLDARSREIVRRDCSTRLGRNEITLFANGTIRLKNWSDAGETMQLAELAIDEADAYVRRLAAVDLRESRGATGSGVAGEWVERCDLVLLLPDRPGRTFRYGRLDTQDLAFSTVARIVDELAEKAAAAAVAGTLPGDYVPRRGDVLARSDGVEFEVVGFTVDGNGIELRGRIDPLTIYMPKSEIQKQFESLVRRGP